MKHSITLVAILVATSACFLGCENSENGSDEVSDEDLYDMMLQLHDTYIRRGCICEDEAGTVSYDECVDDLGPVMGVGRLGETVAGCGRSVYMEHMAAVAPAFRCSIPYLREWIECYDTWNCHDDFPDCDLEEFHHLCPDIPHFIIEEFEGDCGLDSWHW